MFRAETEKEKIKKDGLIKAISSCGCTPSSKLVNIVYDWLDFYNGLFLLSAKDKTDNVLVAVYYRDVIYLLGESYPTIMYAPKMLLSIVDDTHVHIEDILVKNNNNGNGSILMNALFKFAKSKNIDLITGDLSPIDNDHKDRRNHYYEKFGFKITENMVSKRC